MVFLYFKHRDNHAYHGLQWKSGLTLQELAEIGSHGFPRVSCYGQYGSQAGNGRQWPKMDFRVFCAVIIEVTRKAMVKMVENGRKWVAAVIWQEMDFRASIAFSLLLMNRITGYQSNFHFSINITHLQYHFGTKRTKGLLLSIFNKYHPSTCIIFHSIPNMEENGNPSR